MNDACEKYYVRSFPLEIVYRFAARKNEHSYELCREFAATVRRDGDERMWRHLSFTSSADMRAFLERHYVTRIEMGAFYTAPPRLESLYRFGSLAVARELVYDLDADAYDGVRACCRGATLCARCWPLLMYAARSLDHVLRRRLGFKHILWVYSGRRGVHAWVCDQRALTLAEGAREAAVRLVSSRDTALDEIAREAERELSIERFRVHVDIEVSRQLSHLLKVPFSMHPETKHIALPITLDAPYEPVEPSQLCTSVESAATRRFDRAVREFTSFVDTLTR